MTDGPALRVDRLGELVAGPVSPVVDWERILGGHSRVTGRFTLAGPGGPAYVSRSVPPGGGALAGAADTSVEFAVLRHLTEHTDVSIPQVVGYDPDGSVIGSSTVVVEHIEGGSLLSHLKSVPPSGLTGISDDLCDLVAGIHEVEVDALPSVLDRPADWHSYLDDRVAGWRAAAAAHVEPDPFVAYAAAWLDRNRPPPAPLTLVHGDFSPANILRREDGWLLAIDWEFVHVGDPREDLGWCRARGRTSPPSLIEHNEERFLRRYRDRSGLGDDVVNPWTLRYFSVFAELCLLLSVYPGVAAFAAGRTRNLGGGFVTGMLTYAHREWYEILSELEAKRPT